MTETFGMIGSKLMGKNSAYATELRLKYSKLCETSKYSNPIVSIIVPAYNVANYIERCLLSLVQQSFKNIEIIVIDDGSEDMTSEIIDAFGSMDSRLVVIHQQNRGVSAARNEGIEISKGEYIAFVDSDDYVDENFIFNLHEAITKYDCDISVATIIRWRKNHQKYRVHYTEEKIYKTLEEKINVCKIPKCCYPVNKLYKKELILNNYFEEGKYFEDVLWTPEILKQSNKLVTVPNTNYYYRATKGSIVKKNTSKKQLDNYNAKKYIIQFFEENGLELSKKDKNLTKDIKYFLGVPLIKIKEKNFVNTCYLFSLLPIFKYRDFDSHYIFKLFGIRIAKRHKTNFDYKETTKYGLTTDKREQQLIVSLTSFPARINYVSKAINTLLQQSLKPDRLLLWLAESQFPNKENDLPKELLALKELGLEIKWCEDLRSYKKLVPALREFPNDVIVTADDDIYYPKNWLKSLYEAYLKNPRYIYCKRAVRMKIEDNRICDMYKRDECIEVNFKEASFSNQLMGGSGCLYPPHSLNEDVFNINKFLMLIPTHDDIYFWVMAILNGTKIEVVGGFDEEMLMIDGCEECSLSKNNNDKGSGISPKEAFKKIVKEFPRIIDTLKNEG